jgi:hypothetical protein
MANPKAFKASKNGSNVTADTARAAAQKFFDTYPKARKCSVFEGEIESHSGVEYFVQRISGKNLGYWPDVTKKTVETLPC